MNENLTPKQRKAVESLLTNCDTTQAARAAGVSRETLYRWQREPLFQDALNEATRQALEGLSVSLVALGMLAVDALQDVLNARKTPPGAKVRAAEIIINRLHQMGEMMELEKRIIELEKRANRGA